MMERKGRDSTECQNWEKKGHNSIVSYICKKKPKTGKGCRRCRKMDFLCSRERISNLSLDF